MEILLICVLIIISVKDSEGSTSIRITLPHECNDTEFYDKSQLRCASCAPAARTTPSRLSRLSSDNFTGYVGSNSPFECSCATGFYRKYSGQDEESLQCLPCDANTVTSKSGFSCIRCQPDEIYDANSQTCRCENGILLEKSESGVVSQSCNRCPYGSQASASRNECEACHRTFLRNMSGCVCPNQFKNEAGICIPNSELLQDSVYSVHFSSGEIRSKFLARHLQAAVYGCKRLGNRTSCQILANLCVLTHFSFSDDIFEGSSACSEYRKLMSGGGSSFNYQLWPKKAPWLFYGEDSNSELSKNNVPNRFAIDSEIKIMAFRYNALGNLFDVSILDPGELLLCAGKQQSLRLDLIFGQNLQLECSLSAQNVWELTPESPADVKFYDLYLLSNDGKLMYPIPIRNMQLERNGEKVNVNPTGEWQLVRRLFLAEGLSSIEEKGSEEKEGPESRRKRSSVVRFLQSFDISFRMREMDGSGTIYPPLITISYGEISRQELMSRRRFRVSFTVHFATDQKNVERDVSISLSVLCCAAVLWSVFRTWTWNKRCVKHGISVIVLQFLINSAGTISLVFFVVSAGCFIHWFLFFKKQSVLHTLLPTPDQEYMIWVYVVIAFGLYSLKVIHDLIVACTVDIFLIDWERPKSRISQWPQLEKLRSLSSKASSVDEKEEVSAPNKLLTARRSSIQASVAPKGEQCPDVSIWRSIFVANEWLELFSHRKLNLQFHLLSVIVIIKVFRFEEMFKHDNILFESSEDREHVPDSLTCRIAVNILVYVMLLLIQIGYKSLVDETFVCDKMKEFVDLCSVANVSIFIWRHRRFGYYIHGRSPNGRADVNMREMNELLKREENDLCSRRGLVPNTDQQTFEMRLPITMYDQYYKLLSFGRSGNPSISASNLFGQSDRDKVAVTYVMVTKFLSSFIEHTSREFEYIVKDKTILEALLDTEFDETFEKGILYNGMFLPLDSNCNKCLCLLRSWKQTFL